MKATSPLGRLSYEFSMFEAWQDAISVSQRCWPFMLPLMRSMNLLQTIKPTFPALCVNRACFVFGEAEF